MQLELFKKVKTESLKVISEELSGIYATVPADAKLAQFARTLAVYAKCELVRRGHESE
jgi:hypothetical protein